MHGDDWCFGFSHMMEELTWKVYRNDAMHEVCDSDGF